ncbi:MAG: GNAT family N-acetyltransferase [Microscillaceae bacterium]|nr:GNAT family N-acetyltransferase [Microscillaceae bacterium]
MQTIEITLKNEELLSVREGVKEDASAAIDYLNRVAYETDFLSFGGGEFTKTIAEEEQYIERHQNCENQIFLIAEIKGEIAGILTVDASPKSRFRHVVEFGISIPKAHWGKGIGSILIRIMIDWAKEGKVIRKINLKVRSDNESAIQLYKKFGFEIEGLMRRDAFIRDRFFDTYVMGLLID